MLAIVQARLGSTRLPGKVLMEINGKPLIRYMIERLERCKQLEGIVVAVPEKDHDQIKTALTGTTCKVVGCPGDENDVGRRFRYVLTLMEYAGSKDFIRLCADSPMIDPVVVDWMVGQYDGRILTNTKPRTFPAGQCVEILQRKAFCRNFPVWRIEPGDDEHVTPAFYRYCNYVNAINPVGDYSHINMCVDTPEDMRRLENVIGKMTKPHWLYGWRELVEMMQ